MQCASDQEYGWLVAAHIIIKRVYTYCTTMEAQIFGTDITPMEEREAASRANTVNRSRRFPFGENFRDGPRDGYRPDRSFPRSFNQRPPKRHRGDNRMFQGNFRPNDRCRLGHRGHSNHDCPELQQIAMQMNHNRPRGDYDAAENRG